MANNQSNTIYPCPFSKGYGIPVEQAWSLLKVFFIYRFIISSLFVILFHGQFDLSSLDAASTMLFFIISHSYLTLTIILGICAYKRVPLYTTQTQIVIFTDIIFITLLMHIGGGINSGIGILLAISIAAGGLLIGGRCALLFAALASLSIIAEQLYSLRSTAQAGTSFVYAGMLGALFFTIAYLSHVLAKRTEQSAILASQQQQTITNLEELNQYIIQHLQSGIVISNSRQQIKMCNEAVINICNKAEQVGQPKQLSDISPKLSEAFQFWLNDTEQNFVVIQLPNQSDIHVRFSLLKTQMDTFHMIIFEDISLYSQRLQQSKLASLGRLTASIAHEVRNPLGAISHASQLLSEAAGLSSQDQRLTEIIQSHCQRVNTIIEDVLQLSRRQPSNKQKINLKCWLENYVPCFVQSTACEPDSFEVQADEKEYWTEMDEGHLKQIMDNLCSNALEYGYSPTKKIIIQLGFSDSSPYIRVIDNAPELDLETVRQLFEPFFTSSPTGTGLGLYISKELADLNQAKLSYALGENNKSSFKLNLPSADNSLIEL